MADAMAPKRFRVALSFAGEKREFVAKVARILAERFGEAAILYDKFHEAEFARFDQGIQLPKLYGEQSDLIVPVLCPTYDEKRWTGWEWVCIYGLLTRADGHRVMPSRFGFASAAGLSPSSGFIELDDKTPEQFAALILERLAINEGNPKDTYTKPAPTASSDASIPTGGMGKPTSAIRAVDDVSHAVSPASDTVTTVARSEDGKGLLWRQSTIVAAAIAAVATLGVAVMNRVLSLPPFGSGSDSKTSTPKPPPDNVIYHGSVFEEVAGGQDTKPVPLATVLVETPTGSYSGETSADGRFEVVIPGDRVTADLQRIRLRVTKSGYLSHDALVDRPSGGRVADVILSRTQRAGGANGTGTDGSRTDGAGTIPADPSRYVNTAVAALGGSAIVIVDHRLEADVALTSRVAKDTGAVESLFTPSFITEGLFTRIHRGDVEPLKPLRVDAVQSIALGLKTAETTTEEIAGSTVMRATVKVDVRVVFPMRGFSSDAFSVNGVGSGFDENRAVADATERAVVALVKRLRAT